MTTPTTPINLPPGTVILAEKPSVAGDLAKVLCSAPQKSGSYIETRNGVFLTWAIGHLLEQAMPEQYNPEWKRWSWDTLPILVRDWKMQVRDKAAPQLAAIGKLLRGAPLVIIATDAGREGELIAREILDWHKYRGPLKRLWLQAMTQKDILKGFAQLKDGSATEGLHQAALARQRADFLYGINGTRATTLGIRHFKQMYPLGRVQTLTLYLVVKRAQDIKGFQSKEYYELQAEVKTAAGHTLKLAHAPREENRIYDRKQAQALADKAMGANAPLSVANTSEKESPPFPHTLATLQQEANKVLSWSAQKTLDVAQILYEKYKAISYPRTGCQYLSAAQKEEVPRTLEEVKQVMPEAVGILSSMGVDLRDKVFNDAKLEDHHALVPKDPSSLTRANLGASSDEMSLYRLIALRYLRAMAPDMRFDKTAIKLDANGVEFSASGRVITFEGWRSLKSAR